MREAPAPTIYTLIVGAEPAGSARVPERRPRATPRGCGWISLHTATEGFFGAQARPQTVLWYNVKR